MINVPKNQWLNGELKGDYENCRFCEDKIKFAKDWLHENIPSADFENPKTIVDRICRYKLDDISEEAIENMDNIALKRGFIMSGKRIDYERTGRIVLDEFRGGVIGRITLEKLSGVKRKDD